MFNNNDLCIICLETLEDLQLYETSCGHIFHNSCYEKFVYNDSKLLQYKCPVCRCNDTYTIINLFNKNMNEYITNTTNKQLSSWLKNKFLIFAMIDFMPKFFTKDIYQKLIIYAIYDLIVDSIVYKEYFVDDLYYTNKFLQALCNKAIELIEDINMDLHKHLSIIKEYQNHQEKVNHNY